MAACRSIDSRRHPDCPAVVYDFFDKDLKPGELITLAMVQAYEKKHGVRVGKGEIALMNFGLDAALLAHRQPEHLVREERAGDRRGRHHLLQGARHPGYRLRYGGVDMAVVDGKGLATPGHEKHWLPNKILVVGCCTNLDKLSPRCLFVATPLEDPGRIQLTDPAARLLRRPPVLKAAATGPPDAVRAAAIPRPVCGARFNDPRPSRRYGACAASGTPARKQGGPRIWRRLRR